MKVSDDAKAICRSIENLAKEIKWMGVLLEEALKNNIQPVSGESADKCEE